jgi:hypothetical protein
VSEFLAWCEDHLVPSIKAVQPVHVAGYIEELTRARSAPTAKKRLSAIRRLFDWLVVGQVMPANPASSVRGPSHVVKRGKTPGAVTRGSTACARRRRSNAVNRARLVAWHEIADGRQVRQRLRARRGGDRQRAQRGAVRIL